MNDIVFLLNPPFYKGANEQYICEYIKKVLKNTYFICPEYQEVKINESGNFYDIKTWLKHQGYIVNSYIEQISSIKLSRDKQITIIALDFWCPGLEQIYLYNKLKSINAKYIGYIHGASFVEGDLFGDILFEDIPKHMEATWLKIYDVIWHTSKFFIKNLPSWNGVLQTVNEPFDPKHYFPFRETDLTKKQYDIVYTGRLTEDRNPKALKELFSIMINKGYKILLLIPNEKGLFHLFKNLDLTYISGVLEKGEYLSYLSKAKIVVSMADQEGWGYGILKAISVGCIPILPNKAVYPELYPCEFLFDSLDEVINIISWALKNYVHIINTDFSTNSIEKEFSFCLNENSVEIEGGMIKKLPFIQKKKKRIHQIYENEIDLITKHVPIGELLDRILVNSLYNINEDKLSFEEIGDIFNNIFEDICSRFFHQKNRNEAIGILNSLVVVNSRIWGLESKVRKGSISGLSDTDIGIRTIEIRDLNKERSLLKQKISELLERE